VRVRLVVLFKAGFGRVNGELVGVFFAYLLPDKLLD
jgi:hypothetical protein